MLTLSYIPFCLTWCYQVHMFTRSLLFADTAASEVYTRRFHPRTCACTHTCINWVYVEYLYTYVRIPQLMYTCICWVYVHIVQLMHSYVLARMSVWACIFVHICMNVYNTYIRTGHHSDPVHAYRRVIRNCPFYVCTSALMRVLWLY